MDAGPACELTLRLVGGADAHCAVPSGSMQACTEMAECLCAARGRTSSSTELLQCTGWDLTPRGALTFADFCEVEPPARMTMTEALQGLLRGDPELQISETCGSVPALIGPMPYMECATLASFLCPCGGSSCDLDARLGRSCLSMTHAQVACVNERVGGNAPCSVDLASAVRSCAG